MFEAACKLGAVGCVAGPAAMNFRRIFSSNALSTPCCLRPVYSPSGAVARSSRQIACERFHDGAASPAQLFDC